ncbi:hypothetical protein ABZY68_28820 [Streptomyces sp. NPDC006482]|uniref:hypothetical protein n=1 Tax=Streptomyces sp. NPDC006482 TaxID=3154306 RepID=UPI00339F1869
MNVDRLRPTVLTLAAITLAVALTGCQEGGSAAGGAAPSVTAEAPETSGDPGPTAEPAEEPSAEPPTETPTTPATPGPSTKKPTTKKPSTKKSGGSKSGASEDSSADCVDAPPSPDDVDPDEIALYRIEELDGSTGKVNLVLQHGAWGCGMEDTDGAPFVGTGEESRWALDQAAYVTVTTPIVESTENQRIGVQELIDWVDAHPDSGLVFRYETGDDGAIHRLEQVFTP